MVNIEKLKQIGLLFSKKNSEVEDPRDYKANDSVHYSEKPQHALRTLGNEAGRKKGHKEFWRKKQKKKEEIVIFSAS